MINFTARIKNKTFWLTLIPAVLLLVQVVAAPFGYQWDFGVLNEQLAAIINALFARGQLGGVLDAVETQRLPASALTTQHTAASSSPCRPTNITANTNGFAAPIADTKLWM